MPAVKRPLIVIPTYNERDNIGSLIPAILEAGSRCHILVVDDGSPDHTAGAVLALKRDGYGSQLFLESRPRKMGVGSAYIKAFRWGQAQGYDFLIQMDADWSHHPRYLETMIESAQEADFVIGSRYVPGGGTCNWGPGRLLLSRFGTLSARTILGTDVADMTGGFNGWKPEVLQKIDLDTVQSDGYCFQIEMKYRAHQLGFRHLEFPILFDERRAGQSKMSAAIALEACWRVWQLKLMRASHVGRAEAGQPSRKS